ncbi:MAG: hypothetical protein ISS00_02635 [Candidatus Marinimicrobia bacterium]|nr:hypothetical protein [Candidatus Neomarinimicrobiota bacterium]
MNRIVGVLIGFFLISCGIYTFRGSIPPHIRTAEIRTFENQTAEFGIEDRFIEVIDSILVSENLLKIVDSDGDSIFEGTIQSIIDKPQEYDVGENVETYRISMKISASWFDTKNNKMLAEKDLNRFADYPSDSLVVGRNRALNEVIQKISKDIVNLTEVGW